MRVNPFNSAVELANELSSKQVTSNGTSSSVHAVSEDRTTLSSGSTSVTYLASLVLNNPEIRQDRVDSLRQALSTGQYKVDSKATASAMVDDYA